MASPTMLGSPRAVVCRPVGHCASQSAALWPLCSAGGAQRPKGRELHPRRWPSHIPLKGRTGPGLTVPDEGKGVRCAASVGAWSAEPAAVLVVSPDEATASVTTSAVASALSVRCVGLVHARMGPGLTRNTDLALRPGRHADCWVLDGTMADAVTCGLEPGKGLMASLGLRTSLCVVGAAREPSLGEDLHSSNAVSAARHASVIGVPTVALCLPSRSDSIPLEPATQALVAVLRGMAISLSEPRQTGVAFAVIPPPAANCPRAHFPFPTEGRWSGLGGPQLPVDDELRHSLQVDTSSGDFASADCWSLGEMMLPPDPRGQAAARNTLSPAELRGILRRAFRDADTFLCLHVPPRWSPQAHRPFSSTRPGVLWHQETVTAGSTDSGSTGPAQGDLWGRSLPLQTVGSAQPTSDGATFVSQLNTEKVIADSQGPSGAVTPHAPCSFSIGRGTILMDSSARGDVDSIMKGTASLTTLQTWPHGHAFSLLDQVMVEALREDSSGLPLWLTLPGPEE